MVERSGVPIFAVLTVYLLSHRPTCSVDKYLPIT